MRPILTVLGLLALAGCISPEQLAANDRRQQEAHQQGQAAYSASLRSQCESIGYTANTDPWRQCLLQLHTANQQNNAAMRAAIIQQMMQQQARPAPVVPPVRMPTQTNCTRDFMGNLSCTTY